MKKQNGITLIALVITIIVLLILAGVSITAITDDEKGVVTKAKEAVQKTEESANAEDSEIQEIMDYANNASDDAEESDSTEESENQISFTIDGVTYTALEEMKWSEWVSNAEYNTDNIWQVCDGTSDGSDIGYEYIGSYDYELGTYGNINAIADITADSGPAYVKPSQSIIADGEYMTENWWGIDDDE